MENLRGSEKLKRAWQKRILTEEAVNEIADALDQSPAVVEKATFVGGERATGLSLSLFYSDENLPWCGNDIAYWLKWNRRHGGQVRSPKILINGMFSPDEVRLQLDFGDVSEEIRAKDLQELDVNGIDRIRGR